MALAFKERQEHFPQFVYAVRLLTHGFLTSKKLIAKKETPPLLLGAGIIYPRYHPNYPRRGHLGRSVTGAPDPVIPDDAGSGIQWATEGLSPFPFSLKEAVTAWFPHCLCIFPSILIVFRGFVK